MFSFSTSIDHIRDVVRPGVLFFIRDPATQDFHPIREVSTLLPLVTFDWESNL